ncbi:MAG TPA: hypothetical protein VJR23_12495 [Candidatus Acidoferrales bacterium]|nr:hypothetical protein [Candidatus Acidoferrales bacterium]
MLRKFAISAAFLLAFLIAVVPAARAQDRVDGQIFGFDGNPLVNGTVQLKSLETGQSFTVKTDKNGKFIQLGVNAGKFEMTILDSTGKVLYKQQIIVKMGEENTQTVNLKDLAAAQAAANPEAEKKQKEAEDKMKDLKVQFDAGRNALNDAIALKKQISTAPADQKAALGEKLNADVQTALTSFKTAEQDVSEKDVNNQATVLAMLGEAYQMAGQYPESVDAYQKSLGFKPSASVYNQLSLSLVNQGASSKDPADLKPRLADAESNCDKAIALDPALASMCWKNIGVVLTNTHHQSDAVEPLQKATTADPKDAQSWFLLGGALTSTMTYKQEGEKEIMVITPGTAEAYQKCVDTATPGSPFAAYAAQCKASLDELAALGGGVDTNVGKKKKKQ